MTFAKVLGQRFRYSFMDVLEYVSTCIRYVGLSDRVRAARCAFSHIKLKKRA